MPKEYHVKLNYKLTTAQEVASDMILSYVLKNESVIVNAVCGAGKTELVYKSIEHIINAGKKVAFAIPRKDVVKEIYSRISKDFKTISVAAVYGGETKKLDGQIVILTTHQLYRYPSFFDLLILDEADAFPYYKNELLETFLQKACKGPIIYMSATLSNKEIKCNNVVEVNKRFHNKPIPVPQIIHINNVNKIKILKEKISEYSKIHKPLLIFVPTINDGKTLSLILNIPFVFSSSSNREEMIQKFKRNEIMTLLTTSILERGMTFTDVQVIIYDASSSMYTLSSLIQMAGRVGRKMKAPTGDVFFMTSKVTSEIKQCIDLLKLKNQTPV